MNASNFKKIFIIFLITAYMGNIHAALAGSCTDLPNAFTCENICKCTADRYDAIAKNAVSGKSTAKTPNCKEGMDCLTKVDPNTMESGAGSLVQLKAYCDAYSIELDIADKLKLELDLAASSAGLCYAAGVAQALCISSLGIAVPACIAGATLSVACSVLVGVTGGIEEKHLSDMEERSKQISADYSFLRNSIGQLFKESSSDGEKNLVSKVGAGFAAMSAVFAGIRAGQLISQVAGPFAAAGKVAGAFGAAISFTLGALMTVEAVKKSKSLDEVKKLPGEACKPILALATNAMGFLVPNNAPGSKAGQTGSGNSGKSGGAGGPGTALQNNSADTEDRIGSLLNQGQSNASAYDELNKFNNTKLNPQEIDKVLKEHLNTSLAEVHNQLKSGQSVGQVIGNMVPDMPSEIKEGILEMEKHPEKLPKDPWGDTFGLPSVMVGGGGGGGSSGGGDGGNPFASLMNFGQSGGESAAGAGKTSEMNFGGRKIAQAEIEDGDIFHSKWKGSIFSIISMRISKFKGEVIQLEWAGMFNRAMHGLPPLASSTANSKSSLIKGLAPSPSPSVRKAPIVPEFIENR